jgi:hypothetical protein
LVLSSVHNLHFGGFFFGLDQSNICVEMFKRLNIEYDTIVSTTSTKDIPINQKVENAIRGSREIFSRFFDFHRLYIEQQQIPRPIDKNRRRKLYYSLGKRKKSSSTLFIQKRG